MGLERIDAYRGTHPVRQDRSGSFSAVSWAIGWGNEGSGVPENSAGDRNHPKSSQVFWHSTHSSSCDEAGRIAGSIISPARASGSTGSKATQDRVSEQQIETPGIPKLLRDNPAGSLSARSTPLKDAESRRFPG